MTDGFLEIPPFNMESGLAFLLCYLAFSVAGFVVAYGAQTVLGKWLDRPAAPKAPLEPELAPDHGSPYRAASLTSAPHRRLTLGHLPRPDEYPAIAYLAHGERGVVNLLMSAAFAAGWLAVDREDRAHASVGVDPASTVPAHRAFYDQLRVYSGSKVPIGQVQITATSVALTAELELRSELEASGLLRRARTTRLLRAVAWVPGAVLLAIGAIRTVRGISLDRPVSLLVCEMVAVTIAFAVLGLRSRGSSSARATYLAWLWEATRSLRSAVVVGERRDLESLSLIVALSGSPPFGSFNEPALASSYMRNPIAPGPGPATGRPSDSSRSSSASHDGRDWGDWGGGDWGDWGGGCGG